MEEGGGVARWAPEHVSKPLSWKVTGSLLWWGEQAWAGKEPLPHSQEHITPKNKGTRNSSIVLTWALRDTQN